MTLQNAQYDFDLSNVGEKGYFSINDFKWCVKRTSSFDDDKLRG